MVGDPPGPPEAGLTQARRPVPPGSGSVERASAFWVALRGLALLSIAGVLWLFLSNTVLMGTGDVVRAVSSLAFWRSVYLSLTTSTVTTVVVIVFGVPAAFALTRVGGRAGALADNLLAIPLVLPASSVGLALLVAFQWPPVLALQDAVGFRVAYSQAGIVVAQLVLAMAVGVRAWRAAFESVDRRQEQVARTLGSSPARAFFTVILPQARHGIATGVVLAWTRAMAEFGAVLILCSAIRGTTDILPVAMLLDVNAGETERALVLGFALAVACAAPVYLSSRGPRGERDRTSGRAMVRAA